MQKKIDLEKFDFKNYDYKRNLLFCGPTGVGKTMTAKKILERYKLGNDNKLAVYSMKDTMLKQMVKSNLLVLRKPSERQSSIMSFPLEVMLKCNVLLYDDLGTSDVTDAYLRDFTFIIDERIEKGLTTIFTTNLKKDELKEKLNERIVSRLLYNTDVVIFTGEDKRLATTKVFEI